ncbi:GNAT family N-acetyltransferase [Cohnella sp. AR92]|uniref:GNAT family N-acetyltransferase n=1 Tax=Cohnella sp. AR92 TaxID=648716 RepID=UPI000F8F445C|nr:GNAT family protein [Cohnella sp. AR92]RUS46929.1 N-acetyltransferase [Cohnella sp. AR92]
MSESQIYIRFPQEADTAELAALYKRNREFFEEFSPSPGDDYYTEENQLQRIIQSKTDRDEDRRYEFVICEQENDQVIGTVGLTFVTRGPQQSCMIGYSLDQAYNGKGYMTEAVKQLVRYAFEELGFHRIYGEATLRNPGSIRVLEKAGFQKEGIARSKLKVNGVWTDLQVLAIINPADEV